jgi:hypothetical protein
MAARRTSSLRTRTGRHRLETGKKTKSNYPPTARADEWLIKLTGASRADRFPESLEPMEVEK